MVVLWQGLAVDMSQEVGALQETVVLAELGMGKIAQLVVLGAAEAARVLCRMWAADRGSIRWTRLISMLALVATTVARGEISRASSRVAVF